MALSPLVNFYVIRFLIGGEPLKVWNPSDGCWTADNYGLSLALCCEPWGTPVRMGGRFPAGLHAPPGS